MSNPIKKPVTRILTQTEARYLLERFEDIHCYKTNEEGKVLEDEDGNPLQCPAWDWNLEHFDENDNSIPGGCRLKDSQKLCTCLRLAAEAHFVVESRPKNEDDERREREMERTLLERELRRLKESRTQIEEQIMAYEHKIRDL